MRIIFVRHAETAANAEGRLQGHTEFDLSSAGVQQAERLYERFQAEDFQPTHIYTSPLRRTAETARIASRSWRVPVVHWDDLKEHAVGVFSGLTMDEAERKFPDMVCEFQKSRDWDVVRNAETFRQRRARAQRVIDATVAHHSDDDVVMLFTHGGILQFILAALMGTDRVWGVPVGNTAIFEFALDRRRWASEGADRLNNSFWRILRFNDTTHLS